MVYNEKMKKIDLIKPERVKKIREKKFFKKVLALSVFDEPRSKYMAKITVTDRFFQHTLLWLFPISVRPNFLTVFRIISIPFIIFFLLHDNYILGLCLFALAALSDAIDGAIARTRHQITDWGIVFDPLADKILIGAVGLIVVTKLISPLLAGLIIDLEILLLVSSYFRFRGKLMPAKMTGKIKMILQSVGVGLLLLFLVTGWASLIIVATYLLYLSLVFSILSLFVYRSI